MYFEWVFKYALVPLHKTFGDDLKEPNATHSTSYCFNKEEKKLSYILHLTCLILAVESVKEGLYIAWYRIMIVYVVTKKNFNETTFPYSESHTNKKPESTRNTGSSDLHNLGDRITLWRFARKHIRKDGQIEERLHWTTPGKHCYSAKQKASLTNTVDKRDDHSVVSKFSHGTTNSITGNRAIKNFSPLTSVDSVRSCVRLAAQKKKLCNNVLDTKIQIYGYRVKLPNIKPISLLGHSVNEERTQRESDNLKNRLGKISYSSILGAFSLSESAKRTKASYNLHKIVAVCTG